MKSKNRHANTVLANKIAFTKPLCAIDIKVVIADDSSLQSHVSMNN